MPRKKPLTKMVLEHLQKYGRIDYAQVSELAWSSKQPCQVIYYLRRAGHDIRGNGRPATEWTYHGEIDNAEKTATARRHSLGPALEDAEVKCSVCGYVFHVQVWPGEKPDSRRVCHRCRQRQTDIGTDEVMSIPAPSAQVKPELPECKVYRPRDKGFEERAREVTHIKKIKNRATDLAPSVRFSFKY
jgi:hypothetical protein